MMEKLRNKGDLDQVSSLETTCTQVSSLSFCYAELTSTLDVPSIDTPQRSITGSERCHS